jgi:hypothetical protein
LSTPYELNIPFRVSKDYQRLIFLLYSLGLVSVWWYAYPFWVSFYLSIAILVQGFHFFRLGKLYRTYASLNRVGHRWILTDHLGSHTEYTQLRVIYDFGFILRISLSGPHGTLRLLFFRDQLTDDERRVFYFSQLDWRESPFG